jgi:hypothetical protein
MHGLKIGLAAGKIKGGGGECLTNGNGVDEN